MKKNYGIKLLDSKEVVSMCQTALRRKKIKKVNKIKITSRIKKKNREQKVRKLRTPTNNNKDNNKINLTAVGMES